MSGPDEVGAQRSDEMKDADVANGEGPPDGPASTPPAGHTDGVDPDAPGRSVLDEQPGDDPVEPNEPG